MTKEEIENRDLCLPYADKVTERCDENGIPLSNRQWEFMMDAMAELRQALVSGNEVLGVALPTNNIINEPEEICYCKYCVEKRKIEGNDR